MGEGEREGTRERDEVRIDREREVKTGKKGGIVRGKDRERGRERGKEVERGKEGERGEKRE